VAFYISQRRALKEELLRQKRAAWTEGEARDGLNARPAPVRKLFTRRWLLYPAAASVLLAVVLYLTLYSSSPRTLAKDYIDRQYGQLSHTMDGGADAMQQGITAYNSGDYKSALPLFQIDYAIHPENKDALKYQGIVYLRTGDCDKALQEFEELARTPGLISNPGLFLEAVTLLQRNAPGDKEKAKEWLTAVVQQQLDGSKEAAAWLKKF
jgi:tetratricopeptide (TPR) repeat protein